MEIFDQVWNGSRWVNNLSVVRQIKITLVKLSVSQLFEANGLSCRKEKLQRISFKRSQYWGQLYLDKQVNS